MVRDPLRRVGTGVFSRMNGFRGGQKEEAVLVRATSFVCSGKGSLSARGLFLWRAVDVGEIFIRWFSDRLECEVAIGFDFKNLITESGNLAGTS